MLFTGIDSVLFPVVLRVFLRCVVVFLMRETALPRFSFVVCISMRYAVCELGQRVVFALRLLVVLRDLFALRLLVLLPVVAFALLRLGF